MPTTTETSTAYYVDPRVTVNDDGSYTVEHHGSTFDISYDAADSLGWVVLCGDNSAVGYTSADHAIGNLIGEPQHEG